MITPPAPPGFIRLFHLGKPFYINVNNIAGVAPCMEFPDKTVIQLHAGINAGESPGAGRISIGPGSYRTDHPMEGVIGAIEYATKDYR